MTKLIREQILAVRDDGRTNMLDINGVQYYANNLKLFDLVIYLTEDANRKEYWHFIMTGEAPIEDEDEEDDEDEDEAEDEEDE